MPLLRTKPVEFEQVWQEISGPVDDIIGGSGKTFSNDEWHSIYRGVYNICTNPSGAQSEMLFNRLREALVRRVFEISEILSKELDDAEFLRMYCKHFEAYSAGTTYISELFTYLNRYWICYAHAEIGEAPTVGVYPIPELALRIWRDILYSKQKKRVVSSILTLYRTARDAGNNYFEHGDLIASTVEIYIVLGLNKQDPLRLYRDELEIVFLRDAADYYTALAQSLLSEVSISEYLKRVEDLCKIEEHLCDTKMHRITVKHARQTCCSMLIGNHSEEICAEAERFLNNGDIDDLQRVFLLFSELPTTDAIVALKNTFKKMVERNGTTVVKRFENEETQRNPEEYIDALVESRNSFFKIIQEAFHSHPLMRSALDQACRAFANSHSKLPELLAKYAHTVMTKLNHGDESELERKIDNVGIVFCLLDDKDVFKTMYAKFLSKRLIQGNAASMDYESLLVNKLRDICGYDFVSKLQKMFSDKLMSNNTNQQFKEWVVAKGDHKDFSWFDCTFDVFTAGIWPISTPQQENPDNMCNIGSKIPLELQYQLNLFTQFYASMSSGRRLHWVMEKSHGFVRLTHHGRIYELHINYFQLLLLTLYNSSDSFSEAELMNEIGITSTHHLHHHVHPLLKIKLLVSDESGSTASSQPRYKFNSEFTHKRSMIKLLPSAMEIRSPSASAASVENSREIVEARKMTIQAAIVRIMKTRRECSVDRIFSEIKNTLAHQFVPTMAFLQQNLDLLVQKDYIRIAEDSTIHDSPRSRSHQSNPSTIYVYVA